MNTPSSASALRVLGSEYLEIGSESEATILRYERERANRMLSFEEIDDLLRVVPTEQRDLVICELARIDLERRFDASPETIESRRCISSFVEHYGDTFSKDRWRSEIAFEHFRLAEQGEGKVSRSECASMYGVDTVRWKSASASEADKTIRYPMPGEVFCSYPLLAELGRGAIARVFLARQPDLAERLVVLKVTERKTLEADNLAGFQHSNIVPVYSIHRENGLYCICMPYLGILTVADLITNRKGLRASQLSSEMMISTAVAKRLSTIRYGGFEGQIAIDKPVVDSDAKIKSNAKGTQLAKVDIFSELGGEQLTTTLTNLLEAHTQVGIAVEIISGVIDGVAYSHSSGVSHCDIKPENILIANDGRPVLLDFNLSSRNGKQEPSFVGGTIPYMSPQRLRSMESNSGGVPSDDVFAIGVVLYQLLTDQWPFSKDTDSSQSLHELAAMREKTPARLRQYSNQISPSLEAIVLKCLHPDTAVRYPSAIELQEDIRRFREDRVLRYATDRSWIELGLKWIRRHPIVTSSSFLVAIGAVLLATLIATTIWNSDRISKLSSIALAHDLSLESPSIIARLHAPSRDQQMMRTGLEDAFHLMKEWGISENGISKQSPLSKLSSPMADQAKKDIGYMLYAVASTEANLAAMSNEDSSKRRQVSLAWSKVACTVDSSLSSAVAFQNAQVAKTGADQSMASTKDLAPVFSEQTSLLGEMLLARQQRDIPSWQRLADELVTRSPTDPTVWFNLGSAFYSSGNWERALGCYDTAARLNLQSSQGIFWRGVCRLQIGDSAGAQKDFTRCLEFNPDWVAARFNRAVAFQGEKKFQDALSDLDEIVDRKVGVGSRVWVLRSNVRFALGQRELAFQDRQTSLTIKPIDAEDWTSLGLLQLAGEPLESLRSFERALEIDPLNFAAMQNSVHVLSERLNRIDDAIDLLNTMAELRPKDAGIVATRGILAARSGKTSQAVADAKRAVVLRPGPLEQLQIAGIHAMLSDGSSSKTGNDGTPSLEPTEHLKQSLLWVNKALLSNPTLASVAASDSDLKNIKKEPSFQNAIENAQKLLSPAQ